MAGRTEYVIAHPNMTDTVTEAKGGKVPTFATWAWYTTHRDLPEGQAGWVHMGWSFQETLADAQRKALPELRKHGMKVTATKVLPTR